MTLAERLIQLQYAMLREATKRGMVEFERKRQLEARRRGEFDRADYYRQLELHIQERQHWPIHPMHAEDLV